MAPEAWRQNKEAATLDGTLGLNQGCLGGALFLPCRHGLAGLRSARYESHSSAFAGAGYLRHRSSRPYWVRAGSKGMLKHTVATVLKPGLVNPFYWSDISKGRGSEVRAVLF